MQERYDEVIPESSIALLIAFTVSMLLAGGFLGALSIGIFTRNFTRKQSMIIINIINVLSILFGSIAGYFIPSYEAIIIARFFMGFVAGVAMSMIIFICSVSCFLIIIIVLGFRDSLFSLANA